MALYPKAKIRLLPENYTQGQIEPTQVILHTAVDAPGETDLYGFFARGDVSVESHFFIQLDGDVIQYMDTTVRADANRHANVRAISIETEDDGNPNQRGWTTAQLVSIQLLGQWLMKEHPRIARQVCPAWDKPGWGYHSMWGAPSPWTPAKGKTCPGGPRIKQFNDRIVPWLRGDYAPKPKPITEDWLEMATKQEVQEALAEIAQPRLVKVKGDRTGAIFIYSPLMGTMVWVDDQATLNLQRVSGLKTARDGAPIEITPDMMGFPIVNRDALERRLNAVYPY